MALEQSINKSVKEHLEFVLKEIGIQKHVDPNRFYKATIPIIIQAEIIPNGQLQITKLLFDFEEPFRYIKSEKALLLLERYSPKDLASRIGLAHEWSDPNSCFYSLDDWGKALEKFIKYQKQNIKSLLKTGYSKKSFKVSLWLDRHFGCAYPAKYRYGLKTGPWRTKKPFGQFGIVGSPTNYRSAAYFDFLEFKSATILDTLALRNDFLTFRERVFSRLLLYLQTTKEERLPVEEAIKMASDCLIQGNDILSREKIVFLLDQDMMFDANREQLPKIGGTQFPIQPGGFSDVALLVEQVTMEIALRHRSGIRARLCEYSSNSPVVGLNFDLRQFYQDYGIHNGQDFEPIYQIWNDSIDEQNNFSERFWQMAESISKSYLKKM